MNLSFLLHSSITSGNLVDGFMHPINGLDHLLAMLSVGMVSALLPRKHLYLIPLAFVCSMIVGGVFGFSQIPIYFTEIIISLSVIILGLLIIIIRKGIHPGFIYTITIIFGMAHGYAHGIEMPFASNAFSYVTGFALATSLVHLSGIGITMLVEKVMNGNLLKGLAAVIVVIGFWLFAGNF